MTENFAASPLDRVKWLEQVQADEGMREGDIAAAVAIAVSVNSKKGYCFLGADALAEDAHMPMRSMERHIARLKARGHLVSKRQRRAPAHLFAVLKAANPTDRASLDPPLNGGSKAVLDPQSSCGSKTILDPPLSEVRTAKNGVKNRQPGFSNGAKSITCDSYTRDNKGVQGTAASAARPSASAFASEDHPKDGQYCREGNLDSGGGTLTRPPDPLPKKTPGNRRGLQQGAAASISAKLRKKIIAEYEDFETVEDIAKRHGCDLSIVQALADQVERRYARLREAHVDDGA
ncbi:hypothetical protein [Methylocystis echinoides]|uniref:Helix-turn-helix domain-containing protein n=1 Tax=Methylocystis echinoides TaxID=29468 RepID=A0A9W6LTE3_9HYPH|nr:hypothetical protein [Methylocystis echinoides]GLI94299.1 hypothetical protein LMG27198_32910 [Methylocystis echinoides]